MNIIYFNIIQLLIIIIAIIRLKFNSFKKDIQYDKNVYESIIFNGMILPLILYSTIGYLIFTNAVSKSIGWKNSPFQKELGYFTLSLVMIGVYASYKNDSHETLLLISMVWVMFTILAALNHMYEIVVHRNYSFNNIYPIVITMIMSGFVFYYS